MTRFLLAVLLVAVAISLPLLAGGGSLNSLAVDNSLIVQDNRLVDQAMPANAFRPALIGSVLHETSLDLNGLREIGRIRTSVRSTFNVYESEHTNGAEVVTRSGPSVLRI